MKRNDTAPPPEVWLAAMEENRREVRQQARSTREAQLELRRGSRRALKRQLSQDAGYRRLMRPALASLRALVDTPQTREARELIGVIRRFSAAADLLCLPWHGLSDRFIVSIRPTWARSGDHLYTEVGGHWLRRLPGSEVSVVRLTHQGEVPVTGARDLLAVSEVGLEMQPVDTRVAVAALRWVGILTLIGFMSFPMVPLMMVAALLTGISFDTLLVVPLLMLTVAVPLAAALDASMPVLIAWSARAPRLRAGARA